MPASKSNSKIEQLSGNNLLIVLILISLIVIGVTGIIGKSLVVSIIRNTKVVNAKQTADKQLQNDISAAPQLITAVQQLGAQAALLADALPTTSDLPGLSVSLENMASTAGIKLKSLDATTRVGLPVAAAGSPTSANATVRTPQVYPFTISVEGSYDSFKKLIADIELSARPMHVTAIQLSGTGSLLTGTMDVETYYQDKAQLPFSEETIK